MAITKRVENGITAFSGPADQESVAEISQGMEALLESADCAPRAMAQLLVALDEILSNIVLYAYESGTGDMRVETIIENRRAEISFIDTGVPYDPLTHTDPDTSLSAQERDIGGLGILLVKKTMDEVRYARDNGRNILTIVKNI